MTTQQPEALRFADIVESQRYSWTDECAAELRRLHAENEGLKAKIDEEKQKTVLDALHKQMLSALESVGSHTVTDCDGDEIEVYFCNWQAISDAKRAAQSTKESAK